MGEVPVIAGPLLGSACQIDPSVVLKPTLAVDTKPTTYKSVIPPEKKPRNIPA